MSGNSMGHSRAPGLGHRAAALKCQPHLGSWTREILKSTPSLLTRSLRAESKSVTGKCSLVNSLFETTAQGHSFLSTLSVKSLAALVTERTAAGTAWASFPGGTKAQSFDTASRTHWKCSRGSADHNGWECRRPQRAFQTPASPGTGTTATMQGHANEL